MRKLLLAALCAPLLCAQGPLITTLLLPNGVVGTAYDQTLSATLGRSPYHWTITTGALPSGLSMSSGTGRITGTPSTSGTANFTVVVDDRNGATDTRALSILVMPRALSIATAALPDGTVGAPYSQTLSSTGGAGGNQWTLVSGSLPAGLTLSGSGTIAGTPTAAGPSSFTVQVKDTGNTVAVQSLTLQVAAPAISVTTASLPDGTVGTAYSQTLAATGGAGGFQWSVSAGTLPAGLTLSAAGTISGTPTTVGPSSFTVQVKDSANTTATKPLTIQIAAPALTITTASLPDGTVGTAYSQALAATGGAGGYQWSVSAGALPAGLTLSAAGTVSGTPTTVGPSSFTVQVKDSANTIATKPLTIQIAAPALTITTASLPDGTVGTAYSQALAATGGAGGYQWSVSAGALPAGLTLSAAGTISGTPTTVGPSSFTVQVKDAANTTATKPLTIQIAAAALTVTTASLPDGTVGTAYSQALAATGGAGGYQWSVSAGALPAGLTLSAAGTISGTPTAAGPASFTAQVKDAASTTATKPLTIQIAAPALTVTTASLPDGTVGTAYSQALAATGGTGGYQWSVSTGALPAGLTLSAAGTISGTPTAAGPASFTVQVKDSSNATATKALTLQINAPALTITTNSLPNATVGAAYSQALAATGGTGGNQWTLSAGALPAGLSLSAAGTISGTPTTASSASFTVQVKDSSNTTATKALTLQVNAPTLTITTNSLSNATVGTAYSQALAATGGTGGNQWTVSAGSLPAGLSLSASGTISGTPTTAGSASFTVQVKDAANTTATKALTLQVNAPTLTITTNSLPDATVGTAYSQALAATGGTGGNQWTVSAGSLPAGLSLSAAGAISGTPTAPGTASFTVQVKDSSNTTATKALTLAVAAPALVITTTSLPNAAANTPYQHVLSATGGTGAYRWSVTAGALPTGLSLDPGGRIAGTPTGPTSGFTVQVVDATNLTATRALSITVAPALIFTTPATLPGAVAGTAYSATLAATGGTPPYTFAITSGQLPAGITLNAPSGALSGTATVAGSYTLTVQVTDSAGVSSVGNFVLDVRPPLAITTAATLANGSVGALYRQILLPSGGVPPYTWSVASGTLPNGLSLNAGSGELSGTPSQAGVFTPTIQIRDAAGTQVQTRFSLTIVNGLTITTPPVLPPANLATPYQAALESAGGAAPYIWSVTAGALPPGLTFHADGKIDGSPTTSGAFTFTALVVDANSSRATKDFSLTVAAALTITSAAALPGGTIGVPYAAALAAAGGTPPYLFTVASGDVPPGLSLEAPTGALAGIPTAAGTFTFTVTLKDSASLTSQKAFTLIIAPGLTFTNPTALPAATAGAPYSFTLQVTGGQAPYTFRLSAGALPGGLSLNASTGVISGTPSASGTFNFTIDAADAARLSTSRVHSLTVGLPATPNLNLDSFPGTLSALQQPALDLTLSNPYPVAINGRLNLRFTPANGMPDDPSVQFSTGGRSVAFTIPANSVHAAFATSQFAIQAGSVAGTIELTVDTLDAAGNPLPAPSGPIRSVQVASGAPVIRSVSINKTGGGFDVVISALSTTRELKQATVRFHPPAGTNLQTTDATIALTEPAKGWFSAGTSSGYGGQFTLTLPFTFNGPAISLDSVSVVLTNTIGDSAESSANWQ